MNNNILRKTLLSGFITVTAAFNLNAVPVHINSGNPAYPFPQFLEYASGDNLGTKNPEGVVHVEMEQDIRDAGKVEEAKVLLAEATKKIDQACTKGVIVKNTAARKKSSLSKKLNAAMA